MPTSIVDSPYGPLSVDHPEGASNDEIINYAKQNYNNQPSPGVDTLQSIMAAPRKVAEGIVGLPGTIRNVAGMGVDWLSGQPQGSTEQFLRDTNQQFGSPRLAPTPSDIQAQTSKVMGQSYEAQTQPGKYAGSATEGAIGALTGGASLPNLVMGVASGIGSQFGQQALPDHPIVGGIIGGVGGGISAGGIEKGVEALKNYNAAKSAGSEIGKTVGGGPVSSGAVSRLAMDAAANKLTPIGVASTMEALGPEAILMDAGQQFQQRGAVALSRIPGQAQSDVLDTLQGRTGTLLPTGRYKTGAQSAVRLNRDFDDAMGTDVPDMVQLQKTIHDTWHPQTEAAYKNIMSQYDDIGIPDAIKNRPAIQDEIGGAVDLAKNYGKTVKPGSLEYWDYVKKGLDMRINSLIRQGADIPGKQAADLGGLLDTKKSLVSYLDDATRDANGVSQYAYARKLSATEKGLKEASDFGPMLFNNRALPEEVSQQYKDMSIPEQAVARASIRRETSRLMGSVGNDAAKARALWDQNNVTDKTAAIFGQQNAQKIDNAINRENAFQELTNTATKQSISSLAQNTTEDMKNVAQNVPYRPTVAGMATYPIHKAMEWAHGQGMDTTRNDVSRVLLSKDTSFPAGKAAEVVRLLQGYNTQKAANISTPVSQQAIALARSLMAQGVGK